jgi:oligopeptide/dipeptide ABC transporter ATP-binding protein
MTSTETLLKLEDLHVHFKGKTLVKAVDGVSLDVRHGEVLCLVGESGSGKTTVARSIVGLTKPTSGRILLEGEEISVKDRKALRKLWRRAQMIFQDPYSTFNPLSSIFDSLAIPVRKFGIAKSDGEVRKKVEETLVKVGLEPMEMDGKYPHQLSGGQKQRASIARALIIDPEILVADEPVSMLDVSIRAGVLDLMKKLNKEYGVTVVFVTHDLAVADYISDRVAVMYKGKVAELGPVREVIDTPLHPYTELLLRSAPRLRGAVAWSETQDLILKDVGPGFSGCNFYPRCPISVSKCTGAEPTLVEVNTGHSVACYVRSNQA